MTIHKLSAGSGYEYLTGQVAAYDSTKLGTTALADYYSAKGEAPGRWVGSGLVGLGGVGVGEVVTGEQMGHLFGRGEHPVTGRQLGRAYRRGAVAGFDLTFSPVKSVSALWAVAPPEIARVIEQAHDAAVADALAYLEREVLFTREGADGARQVETRGLVAVAFRHRDSRAGDPDLHTHVAVANRVQTMQGKWLTIYAHVLYQHAVAVSETYNTALEQHLCERLGVEFAPRPGPGREKRPAREIVGVDAGLCRRWSFRRVSSLARREELIAEFTKGHGRVPSKVEELALAQRANLETRRPKHEPGSEGEQRAAWRRQAAAALGSDAAISKMVRTAVRPAHWVRSEVSAAWVADVAAVVVQELEESRAVWQMSHIRAEVLRQIRGAGIRPAEIDAVVGQVVEAMEPLLVNLTPDRDTVTEPVGVAVLRRSDGTSVYRHTGSDHFTSPRVLAAEDRLVAAAGTSGGFFFTPEEVEVTLTTHAIDGMQLNRGQRDLVAAMAASRTRLRVGLAPAGTGKTTAMRALRSIWADRGYEVVGLAPSAAAAAALRDATGMFAETLAKLDYEISRARDDAGRSDLLDRIGKGTLVVVDEAGMAGTLTLDRVVAFCLERGAVVRLVGDDQQLAAVGAGGVLRDIAEQHGADRLEEVVRFDDPVEAQASLDLREGDSAALGFYLDHDRVHAGDEDDAVDGVFDAWACASAEGRDCLMLAPTNQLVAELNLKAREARLAGQRPAREVVLGDGSAVSVGDVVITRRNERRLGVSGTDWVKNGDRWIVTGLTDGDDRDSSDGGGGLRVRHAVSGLRVTLPAEYVATDLELGYASTVHTAQGLTADVMHGIVTGEESRQLLYTMLTRGRSENHVHVVIERDPESENHDLMLPGIIDQLEQATATDVLGGILARDGAAVSATTTFVREISPATQLHHAATRYADAVALATRRLVGGEWDMALEAAGVGPLPWLPGVPAEVARHQTWGPYLQARAKQVAVVTDAVRLEAVQARERGAAPLWARRHRGVLGGVEEQVLIWRAANGVSDGDRRLLGPPATDVRAGVYQRSLRDQISTNYTHLVRVWEQRVADLVGAHDEQTITVAKLLDRAERDGHDASALLVRAIAGRPLPKDHPTAALAYRLRRQMDHRPPRQGLDDPHRRQASAGPRGIGI